jgi:hypothetical protein
MMDELGGDGAVGVCARELVSAFVADEKDRRQQSAATLERLLGLGQRLV